MRGAALLDTSFGEVGERIRLMNEMYRLRSDVVHGRADEAEVTRMVHVSASVLKSVYCWYLNHIDEFKSTDEALVALDAAMVDGGSTWARKE